MKNYVVRLTLEYRVTAKNEKSALEAVLLDLDNQIMNGKLSVDQFKSNVYETL